MSDTNNVVKHKWGVEVIWTSTEQYEGSMLVFEKEGNKTPLHFHTKNARSWFVNSGTFKLRWIDTKTAGVLEADLKEGNTYTAEPFMPIQLVAMQENSSISQIKSKDDEDEIHFVGH